MFILHQRYRVVKTAFLIGLMVFCNIAETSAQPITIHIPMNNQKKPPLVQPGAPGQPSRNITTEESLAMSNNRFTEADTTFMQMMITHHTQAIEMVALIEKRTNSKGVFLLGKRISISQYSEINMMQTWLRRRGQPLEVEGGQGAHSMPSTSVGGIPSDKPIMVGMISAARMMELKAAKGKTFERLFLTAMTQHHQGALHMVKELLATPGNGEGPEVSDFLNAIVAEQSTEILKMKIMLNNIEGSK
ncbi:MAG: DUF305 domain-containing protein [Sphingomonadales bacterium]